MVAAQRDVYCPRSRGQVVSRVEQLGQHSKAAHRKSKSHEFNPSRLGSKGAPFYNYAVIGLPAPCAVGEENRDGAVGTLVPFSKRVNDVQR